jgi:protein CpxP
VGHAFDDTDARPRAPGWKCLLTTLTAVFTRLYAGLPQPGGACGDTGVTAKGRIHQPTPQEQTMQKPKLNTLAGALLAATVTLGLAQAVQAQPADGQRQMREVRHGDHAHGDRHHRGGRGGPMRMLRALNLSEAQKDQVFRIFHEQAPAMREQRKAMRASREEMRRIASAPSYDQNAARAAAERGARASANLAVMRTDMMAKVRAILTPEQRAQADRMMAERAQRGERGDRGDRRERREPRAPRT